MVLNDNSAIIGKKAVKKTDPVVAIDASSTTKPGGGSSAGDEKTAR